MASDGITTSGLERVSNITDLDLLRNYVLMDSAELDKTIRVSLNDLASLFLGTVANRLNESGILPFVKSGVTLAQVRSAILDDDSDIILDVDGNLIEESV